VNDEGAILFGAENLIEKSLAGILLIFEHACLALAGVDQKAEGEREIGFT